MYKFKILYEWIKGKLGWGTAAAWMLDTGCRCCFQKSICHAKTTWAWEHETMMLMGSSHKRCHRLQISSCLVLCNIRMLASYISYENEAVSSTITTTTNEKKKKIKDHLSRNVKTCICYANGRNATNTHSFWIKWFCSAYTSIVYLCWIH